jgi:16S rRNA (guanine966-N2)-methyltransferase
VRETLFNWLQPHVRGARCLDLFAGSGILGFEALSRGAERASLVEHDRALCAALTEHAQNLGANALVACEDAARFLARSAPVVFDIVFLDPPYTVPLEPLLAGLLPLLREGAVVYVERSVRDGLPTDERLRWLKTSRAGAVCYGLATLGESCA